MKLSGIADEAGKTIEEQIEAHKKLGWELIEIRNVDSVNLTRTAEADFERICAKLDEAGIRVSCFASEIANWARKISGDFRIDADDLKNAIPRMKKLNAKFIRVMSYPNDGLDEGSWEKEALKRLKELTRIAEDGDIILAHENCSGWGGESPRQCLELVEKIDSPCFRVLFDTGNPVCHGGDSWKFYSAVKPHIVYVHIKDVKKTPEGHTFTYPGEGDGCVREIIADLKKSGYDGVLSIEPHLKAIVHEGKEAHEGSDASAAYVTYGEKLARIVGETCPSEGARG